MTSNTTTTPGKVAKGRKSAFQKTAAPTPPRRQLRWPRAELAEAVKDLTGKAYAHDYLSEVARGARTNAPLKKAIDKAAEILDARHRVSN